MNVSGELGEMSSDGRSARPFQQALETEHGVKHPWAVSHGGNEAAPHLTVAHPQVVAERIDSFLGMFRDPPNRRSDQEVRRAGPAHSACEDLLHRPQPARDRGNPGKLLEASRHGAAHDLRKGHLPIAQF